MNLFWVILVIAVLAIGYAVKMLLNNDDEQQTEHKKSLPTEEKKTGLCPLSLKNYLRTLCIPISVVIINGLLFKLLGYPLAINIVIRLGAVFFAGWLIIKNDVGGLWKAALAGATLIFIDHVLLSGGYFLVVHLIKPESLEHKGLNAFFGVIISYIMFIWVPLIVAYLGGLLAKLVYKNEGV